MDIKGLAAIITGGASGLGRATAGVLVRAGARVSILDTDTSRLEEAAQETGATPITCDVTDPDSVHTALKTAKATHGPARICVNCAGIVHGGRIVGRNGPMDPAGFHKTIAINLVGTFHVMSQAASDMMGTDPIGLDGERGIIVNTASIAAFDGQIGQAAYAASKGGVAALSLPAAREFAPHGIRVMCIAPGLFETPMIAGLPRDVHSSLVSRTLFPRRLGQAEEFGHMVLAVVNNPMLNGETIRLDGALRLEPK